jgi:hypothetical protein
VAVLSELFDLLMQMHAGLTAREYSAKQRAHGQNLSLKRSLAAGAGSISGGIWRVATAIAAYCQTSHRFYRGRISQMSISGSTVGRSCTIHACYLIVGMYIRMYDNT